MRLTEMLSGRKAADYIKHSAAYWSTTCKSCRFFTVSLNHPHLKRYGRCTSPQVVFADNPESAVLGNGPDLLLVTSEGGHAHPAFGDTEVLVGPYFGCAHFEKKDTDISEQG